jgi:hypothetical protein
LSFSAGLRRKSAVVDRALEEAGGDLHQPGGDRIDSLA